MKKRLIIFLILISGSLAIFSISQNISRDASLSDLYQLEINLSPEEIQWVNENRTIRVAGPKSFPPLSEGSTT